MLGLVVSLGSLVPLASALLGDIERHSTIPTRVANNHNAVLSADNRHLYVTGHDNIPHWERPGIYLYTLDQNRNAEFRQYTPIPNLAKLATHLLVSPDGRHVYAGAGNNIGQPWGFWTHTRAADGRLTRTQAGSLPFGRGLREWAIDASGRHVYFTLGGSLRGEGEAGWFVRNPTTGELTFARALEEIQSAAGGLLVSHDGRFVYIGNGDGGIVVFARDSSTGALVRRSQATIDGERILSIVQLGTSDWVFASGSGGGLYVFMRNPTSGALTLRQSLLALVSSPLSSLVVTNNGLYGANGLLGLASFVRSPATGVLRRLSGLDEWPGRISNLVMTQATDTLFVPRAGAIHRYSRTTSCGRGVREPCTEAEMARANATNSRAPDLVCTLSREAQGDTAIRMCRADVYSDERRGFYCDSTAGVSLGIDRVPLPDGPNSEALSFLWRDLPFGRGGFPVHQQAALAAGLMVTDSAVIRTSFNSDESYQLQLHVNQGSITLCAGARAPCCVLGAQGGTCRRQGGTMTATRSNVCASGWRVEWADTGIDPQNVEACAVRPLVPLPIPSLVQSVTINGGSSRGFNVRVSVQCTRP